jgi:hypothetical protein
MIRIPLRSLPNGRRRQSEQIAYYPVNGMRRKNVGNDAAYSPYARFVILHAA